MNLANCKLEIHLSTFFIKDLFFRCDFNKYTLKFLSKMGERQKESKMDVDEDESEQELMSR